MNLNANTLIIGFVAIVIGASLVPALATVVMNYGSNYGQWTWSNNNSFGGIANVSAITGASLAMYLLLTLFAVVVVIFIAVRLITRN